MRLRIPCFSVLIKLLLRRSAEFYLPYFSADSARGSSDFALPLVDTSVVATLLTLTICLIYISCISDNDGLSEISL